MAVAAVAALLVAGCSGDQKAASKANFKAALQEWFDRNPVCTTLAVMSDIPIVREARDRSSAAGIDAAVSAGLLSVESFREVPPFGRTPEDYRRYRPTDTGKTAIRKGRMGSVDICFARREIESIETFTEPADMAGIRLSRVTYRYGLADVAPWTNDAAIKAALPAIGQILASPPNRRPIRWC
ncbi:hypothetical protein RN629_16590 [Sphingomonadaceae bacterium jetA1]|uniref:hypothetical protein n=1 Tax=Facivitalis istanbulensis TaxID=3075838 RepID=UPI00348D0EDA